MVNYSMKLNRLAVLLILLLISAFFIGLVSSDIVESAKTSSELYFGVDVAFENLTETLHIVDKVSSYTNLFVIGCYGPTTPTSKGRPDYNETRLDVISEYVYS